MQRNHIGMRFMLMKEHTFAEEMAGPRLIHEAILKVFLQFIQFGDDGIATPHPATYSFHPKVYAVPLIFGKFSIHICIGRVN